MQPFRTCLVLLDLLLVAASVGGARIRPKVVIISMFTLEANVWYNIPEFNVLSMNVTVPGFSPLFPDAHCTKDGSVCQVTIGQAEINAASTISSLIHSSHFDLASTYFLIAGIAGVNPRVTTIGSVAFARYAVQVGLQHEFDAREMPAEFSSGYFPQGSNSPDQYPGFIDGTEVFELNDALRARVMAMAKDVKLHDTVTVQLSRSHYASSNLYSAGASPPSIVKCDTATSDTFWNGVILGETFENTTQLFTNGSGIYCMSQQEDNATLGALLRGALFDLIDFSRIVIMRVGSNFDRPSPGGTPAENLSKLREGFVPALQNIRIVGVKVVQGIIEEWKDTYERGIEPENYVGDILGSLGGQPDFGPGTLFVGKTTAWPGAYRSKVDAQYYLCLP